MLSPAQRRQGRRLSGAPVLPRVQLHAGEVIEVPATYSENGSAGATLIDPPAESLE